MSFVVFGDVASRFISALVQFARTTATAGAGRATWADATLAGRALLKGKKRADRKPAAAALASGARHRHRPAFGFGGAASAQRRRSAPNSFAVAK